jgi:hypothetical protein
MTNILQNKLARKVVLLFALTAALAYLRAPGEMQAETCGQQCDSELTACIAACKGNSTCEEQCAVELEGRLKHCIE